MGSAHSVAAGLAPPFAGQNAFRLDKRDAYLKFRWDRTPCKKLYLLVSPPFLAPFDPFFFMESSF